MQDGVGSNPALTNKSAICWEVFLQVLEICGACAIQIKPIALKFKTLKFE